MGEGEEGSPPMGGPQDRQGEESSLEIRGEREVPVKERSFGGGRGFMSGFYVL